MEAKRRKPLSNCTNTISTRNSNSSSNTAKSLLKSPNLSKSASEFDVLPEKHIEFKSISPNPRSSPSVPVTPPLRVPNPSSTDSGKPLIEYTRRQSADKTKGKGKMVALPLSCPPVKRTRYSRGDVGDAVLSTPCAIPRKRMEIMKTPSTFKMPEKYKQLRTSPNVKSDTSIGLNGMRPRASPPVPSTPLRHKPNPSSIDSGSGTPLIEYTRRQSADRRKEKGKMVAAPSSCPPEERNKDFRDDVGDVQVSKSCTIPCKRKHCGPAALDKDDHAYFEQQRAYFAEIDAFELTEEIASENESV